MQKLRFLLISRKYETLLIGLVQHIFISMFVTDLDFYARTLWPINMVILGVSGAGLFAGKASIERILHSLLLFLVVLLPLGSRLFDDATFYMQLVSFVYVAYFGLLFYEVMVFLIKPGSMNSSVLIASVCGFLLLLEIFAFTMQFIYYNDPDAILHINQESYVTIFIDILYFCVVTITTVGFGDITPGTHKAKMLVSLFAIISQIYNVVLVGIIISRFSNRFPQRGISDE